VKEDHERFDRLFASYSADIVAYCDREILLLAEWEGLSHAEIATVMGCLAVTARCRAGGAGERSRCRPRRSRAPAPWPRCW
jgi:Sigma-70, region 4